MRVERDHQMPRSVVSMMMVIATLRASATFGKREILFSVAVNSFRLRSAHTCSGISVSLLSSTLNGPLSERTRCGEVGKANYFNEVARRHSLSRNTGSSDIAESMTTPGRRSSETSSRSMNWRSASSAVNFLLIDPSVRGDCAGQVNERTQSKRASKNTAKIDCVRETNT
jgi:hypothetical protein